MSSKLLCSDISMHTCHPGECSIYIPPADLPSRTAPCTPCSQHGIKWLDCTLCTATREGWAWGPSRTATMHATDTMYHLICPSLHDHPQLKVYVGGECTGCHPCRLGWHLAHPGPCFQHGIRYLDGLHSLHSHQRRLGTRGRPGRLPCTPLA